MGSFGKYLSLCLVIILSAYSLWMANLSDAQTTPYPSATFVTGVISSDITWTKANSPYNVTDAVIAKGVTVTIEPGTIVIINALAGLEVNGTLRAIGTGKEPITLNGDFRMRAPVFASSSYNGILTFSDESQAWDDKTGTGCIIENANVISLSIRIHNATIKLNNNVFSGLYEFSRLRIEGGNSIITNNRILADTVGAGDSFPASGNNIVISSNGATYTPNTTTPPITPAPSVPEFPLITILPLLAVLAITATLILRNKRSIKSL